jgi:hypothetical protein
MPAKLCLHVIEHKKERECANSLSFLQLFSQLNSGGAVK